MTNTQKILTALTSWILVVVFIVALIACRVHKMNETPVEQEVATVETVEEVVEEEPVEEVIEEPVEEEPEVVEEQVEEETEESTEWETNTNGKYIYPEGVESALKLFQHGYNDVCEGGEIVKYEVVSTDEFTTAFVTLQIEAYSDSYWPNENPEYQGKAEDIAKSVWESIDGWNYECDGGVSVIIGDLTGNVVTMGAYTPQ